MFKTTSEPSKGLNKVRNVHRELEGSSIESSQEEK